MKKYLKKIVFLIFLFIFIKGIIYLLTTNKNSTYIIKTKKEKYEILENYQKENKNNIYSFTVSNKKNIYNFTYNKNLKKEAKIIKNIKKYRKNNLECIIPIYKDNNTSGVYCLLDNKQVSYSYLKLINNKDIDELLEKENKKTLEQYQVSNDLTKYKDISIYKNNIDNNVDYTVWYYKGLYTINNKDINYKKLLNKDKYENDLSILINNYYVIFNPEKMKNKIYYQELLIYNIENKKTDKMILDKTISIDSYINGVDKNKLYVTDIDSKKQYTIDINNKKQEEIGNDEKGYITIEENKELLGKLKRNIFKETTTNQEITKLYKTDYIVKTSTGYYFKTSDDTFYEVINNDYKHPIKLFKMDNIKEIKIKDTNISFIKNDIVYNYSNLTGLKPIIKDNELKYNYKNIYDFRKK